MDEPLRQALLAGEQCGVRYSLTPPRIASSTVVGAQLGQRSGSSIEFMDHREYQPGDDIRRIDWSSYARSDRLIVKLYREEISPHLDQVIDTSRSMHLPQTAKAQAALGLASLFATAASNSAFTHALWTAGDGFERIASAAQRPIAWPEINFDYERSMENSFARLPPTWRRQGVRLLLSDLLWPGDPLAVIRRLSIGAASLVIVQVLARQDVTPPARGNVRLVDSETQGLLELFIDATAEKRYRQTFERHQDSWRDACHQVGATMITVIAEDLLQSWDMQPFVAHQVLQMK
jgi:uncharacterized protein (DUF58 family)